MSARKQEKTTALTGSERAKQQAAVILEVFAGLRGALEAGEAMGVSPNRYYQLEARGLQGMITALEPRPRGRHRGPKEEIARLTAEQERMTREVTRLQSLVRAAQRSLGVPAIPKRDGKSKGRRRRPSDRGKKVVALLRKPKDDDPGVEAKAS
jgi:hypothetical protein